MKKIKERKIIIKSTIKKNRKIKKPVLKKKEKLSEDFFSLMNKKIGVIKFLRKKLFSKKNYRHVFLNKKSYYIFRRKYKHLLFNRFSRKLIRRMIYYFLFKLIKKIKKLKEKEKTIVVLRFFENNIYNTQKKVILRKLSFIN